MGGSSDVANNGSKTENNMEKSPWHALIHWNDLEPWQQDNQYIHAGYRKASYSLLRSIQSMLYWHNESINIWTHFLPGVLSIPSGAFLYSLLKPRYELASSTDVFVMSCFFFGAAAGMTMSGIYHTLSDHSPTVSKFWNQLDYVGIALMIWGSFIPSVYYGFWCDDRLRKIYWSMITVVGNGCVVTTMNPVFRTPACRPYRAAMFAGMGLCAIFPVLHGLAIYGFHRMLNQIGLGWLVLQGVFYLTGALLYALRFPESRYPGRVDKFGASHQIFHVFVVLAAGSHLMGLLKAFDYRHGLQGATCVPLS